MHLIPSHIITKLAWLMLSCSFCDHRWPNNGASSYEDNIITREEIESSSRCFRVANDCQVHGLAIDDENGYLYYGYSNADELEWTHFTIHRANKDGSNDVVVYSHIYYERPDVGQ